MQECVLLDVGIQVHQVFPMLPTHLVTVGIVFARVWILHMNLILPG